MLYPKDYKLTKEDVVDCLIVAISGVRADKWITGKPGKSDQKKAVEAMKYLAKQEILIDDKDNK